MVGLDPKRLAEVIVTDRAGAGRRGTGYRVTRTSVLTAAHVVGNARSVTVRFDADQPSEWSATAEPGWCDAETDLAVLIIDAPTGGGETPTAGYGRLGDVGEFIDAHTAGFPLWKLRRVASKGDAGMSAFRDLHHGESRIAVMSNRRTGRLEVEVSPPRENPDPDKSPWEGMSGAPLWARDRIIGIIGEHHLNEGSNWLTAIRIDRCLEVAGKDRQRLATLLGLPAALLDLPDVTTQSSAPPAVHKTLPADTAAFTGRGNEIGDITEAVTAAAQTGTVVAIYAFDGMPGVGKTALAIHIGHRLTLRFPDGQLFVDLHAHSPGQRPTDSADALASLLSTVGVPPENIPDGLPERAARWRDQMAGKRALLILDNAARSDQVVPLLPGTAECLVLITSRRHLGDLPPAVVQMPLDVLSPDDAARMFRRLAPRAAGEPAKVAELVALCQYLPLAIRLLAGVFEKHRSWTVENLIAGTKAKLLTVKVENQTVAAAFDLSYQYLPTDRQCFFRHLGLHPGVDIDPYAAAALTGLPLAEATEHLDALYSDHLLAEGSYHRYGMHDLIRDYTHALAIAEPTVERDQALERLLDYYEHTAAAADTHLARQIRTVPSPAVTPGAVPELPGRAEALAWLQTERANLLACIDHASHHSQRSRVVGLTSGLASLLRLDGPWTRAITLHAAAAAAARHIGDDLGEANALHELGVVRYLADDYSSAAQMLEQALDLYRDLGNKLGEANALHELGGVRYLTGDYPGAAQMLERALDLYRDLGGLRGEANALNYLGCVRYLTGDYPAAARAQEQALDLYRDLGDRRGEANALHDLGLVRQESGNYLRAAEAHEQALSLYRDLGNRLGEAYALNYLGVVRYLTGDYQGAAQLLERALDLHGDLADRAGEAEVLNHRGTLRRLSSEDLDPAVADHRRALDLARAVHAPLEEARALEGVGRCALARGDTVAARAELQQALTMYQRIGAVEAARLAVDLVDLGAK
jgi:tetratricopeptide (TPR) repeat protein